MKTLLEENVLLAPFTTLGIGGPAKYFLRIPDENSITEAIRFASETALPVFVLGGGSNLLVADRGFPGIVLKIEIRGIDWETDQGNAVVRAGAGEEWDDFVRACVQRDLAGLECLSGIPGSVGGTPIQNVGAYGQEVSDVISAVRAYDRASGSIVELSGEECRFAYRNSLFNTTAKERYIVVSATYRLSPHGPPAIRYADVQKEFTGRTSLPTLMEVREAVRRIRARKAMLLMNGDPDCRSAGSFFKNPVLSPLEFSNLQAIARAEAVPCYETDTGALKTSAAWLIEKAGFPKGFSAGPVGLSTKHTLAENRHSRLLKHSKRLHRNSESHILRRGNNHRPRERHGLCEC